MGRESNSESFFLDGSKMIEILRPVEQAIEKLREAEMRFEDGRAIERRYGPTSLSWRDYTRLETHLHAMTHEIQTTLGLMFVDAQRLIHRLDVRAQFPQLGDELFEEIVNSKWSTSYVQELHHRIGNALSLDVSAVSELVKNIHKALITTPPLERG